MKRTIFATLSALALTAGMATAEEWTLDGAASKLAFGSVKNAYTGEVHSFGGLSGSVKDGQAAISIDLASVETWIDIRNERMVEHVFNNIPDATINAEIDMSAIEGLAEGDTAVVDFEGTIGLLGNEVDVFTEVFVARMTGDKVLVTTNEMVMIATDELGLDAGIDKLQEIAGLDSITRSVPVTIRLVFDKTDPAS
ncbi:MAG: YceI family protein [Pseudomonadota bacterium]